MCVLEQQDRVLASLKQEALKLVFITSEEAQVGSEIKEQRKMSYV